MKPTRRTWLKAAGVAGVFSARTGDRADARDTATEAVLDIGSRRELFVDRCLIESLDGTRLKLHEPQLTAPSAKPANDLEYGTVIKDGDLFRLYTRDARGSKFDGDTTEVTRYCESRDGIHWTGPNPGLCEVDGTSDNNVILHEPWVCHNFSPFLDGRPDTPVEQRFKALAGVHKGGGLVAFTSSDGIHWKRLQDEPVITSEDNVVPTGPTEMSIDTMPFRRFTLRTDGFASVNAGADAGEMTTRPIRFEGATLVVNYSTSAGGSLKVELQDDAGQPLPGFALTDCNVLVGDSIEQTVSWKNSKDLTSVAGKPVRLRVAMREADLFSVKFNV